MRLRRKKKEPNYVVLQRSEDGQWYYKEVNGGNHKTLSVSETYTRKADARRAAVAAFPELEIRTVE